MVFWYWWAGAAAAGFFLLVVPGLSLELQLFVFGLVSVISAVVLRPTLKRLQRGRAQDETINARGSSLVGRTIVLDAPILNGRGRVRIDDGSWTVTGPDMVAGARVRVTAVNGTELAVEPSP